MKHNQQSLARHAVEVSIVVVLTIAVWVGITWVLIP